MSHQTPANELQTVGNVKFAATVDIESQQASKRLVGGDDASPMISSDYPPDGGCVPCCCYKRRIGNVFVLYENETADGQLDIKLLAPVCWPMIFVSLGAPLSVAFLCFKFTLPQLHWAFSAIGLALVGCFAASLLLTSLRDFGIFPRYHSAQGPNWNWSRQSQSFRPPGVVFCSESKVCASMEFPLVTAMLN